MMIKDPYRELADLPVERKSLSEKFPKTARVLVNVGYLGLGLIVALRKLAAFGKEAALGIAVMAGFIIIPALLGSVLLIPTSLKYDIHNPLFFVAIWVTGFVTLIIVSYLLMWGGEESERRKRNKI